jgi:uncharacterized membrane protein
MPLQTMDASHSDLEAIRQLIGELTRRVYRIERTLGLADASPSPEPVRAVEPIPTIAKQPAATGIPGAPSMPMVQEPASEPKLPYIPPRPVHTVSAHAETDLESRIGSHWLNRIGIAALLIGVSYFLKFAFENNWIGPSGRVSIGLLAGIAVVVWSERFRTRGYRTFSYSLKAVGIGTLYLSLWAAFQIYSLIPSGVAFVAMLAVTSATGVMAVTQDAEILAAFALTGGFTTPFLLSTGQNRELALFSYVALLDVAALVLVVFKPWRRVLLLSYAGTLVLYLGWYSTFYSRSQLSLTTGFATLFFAIFAAAPVVAQSGAGAATAFSSVLPFLAFVNAGAYFLEIYGMFSDISKAGTAWFAVALAAVYIVLGRQVRARQTDPGAAQTLQFLHLALAIGFITIAIPIRLDAHWITIGWFVEAAVLLWVAERIHSDFLNAFAVGALVLGVARLLVIDNFSSTTLIFNARMATYTVAIAVLGILAWYGRERSDELGQSAAAAAVIALNLLALIALGHEIADYYAQQVAGVRPALGRWNSAYYAEVRRVEIARDFTYSALGMAYGAMLMIVGVWRRSAFVRWQALVLIAVTIVKVFVYDVSELDRAYRILSFIVLGVLLLAISFVYQRNWLQLSAKKSPEGNSARA